MTTSYFWHTYYKYVSKKRLPNYSQNKLWIPDHSLDPTLYYPNVRHNGETQATGSCNSHFPQGRYIFLFCLQVYQTKLHDWQQLYILNHANLYTNPSPKHSITVPSPHNTTCCYQTYAAQPSYLHTFKMN